MVEDLVSCRAIALRGSLLVGLLAASSSAGAQPAAEPCEMDSGWQDYRDALATLEPYYAGLPTKVNVGCVWFRSLHVAPERFSTRIDDFAVSGSPEHGVGYGSFAPLAGDRQLVFYSSWVPEQPSMGSAFALEYEAGVPTSLDYLPIEGSTFSWVLDNGDGSRSVVFVGVDEGKLSIGQEATSPSYTFDLGSRQWSTLNYQSTSHNSIPFDYDDDGDEDVVAQAWNEPFPGAFYILRNDGGSFTPVRLGDTDGAIGGMSVAPLGWQSDGTFAAFVGDGAALPEFGIGGETNTILSFAAGLDDVVAVAPVAEAYFEAPVFEDVPLVVPGWEGNVGTSHDVAAKALDLDRDGDLDLVVSSMIWSYEQPYNVLQFLINEDGVYRDDTRNRLYNWSLPGGGQHRLDFLDVNGDGFVDILTSDHGSAPHDPAVFPGVDPRVTTGSRVLVNDGTGHFVTVVHQQIDDGFGYRPSLIPSLDAQNRLRWTVIDPRGTSSVEVVTRALDGELSTGPNMTDPAAAGAPGFNEFYYLLHNPDVVDAVEQGLYESGLAHYLAVGRAEGRFPFAPGGGPGKAITITSPSGGESWTEGTVQEITWTSANLDAGGSTHVNYWDNGWHEVASVAPSSTSLDWTVADGPVSATWLWVGNWANGAWEEWDLSRTFRIGCSVLADLVLSNETVSTAVVYEACGTITAGTGFAIVAPGDASFRARSSVVLENGFSVETGGRFTAALDPTLQPPTP